jgi:tetratricopeptide (TPR) repeat protein
MDQLVKRILRGMIFIVIIVGFSSSLFAEVKGWEGTIRIPTYPWEEDINPKFWALEGAVKGSTTVKGSIVYPYTMQDHLSRTKVDRTYKALFLENEYLKITCLPELGGRLHSVLDKTRGEEMFHLNRVIKPSMIAMRGAFISGGVEWNAGPHVHTVTILSPVNAVIGKTQDGSGYLEVSNLEKSLRTRWTVRVTLHPGKAYLDERIRLYNPVDALNPYYFWNCTAFPSRKGTRFIYPMTLGTDHHGVKFFSWPIHEGEDLSWLRNYETWASIFSVNCSYDFFGAYDVDADRGVVQYANHHKLGGKKAWTWGTWEYGLVSQQNLTDEDGPYIEVQSGPLPTQSDYGMLAPRGEVSWQEWWYPVHGLGEGFEYATKDVAVQSLTIGDQRQWRIISTGNFPRSICTIRQGDRKLLETKLDLSPADPQVVNIPAGIQGAVNVDIRSGKGRILASFDSPLPIPKEIPPELHRFWEKPDDELSLQEKYLKGLRLDRAMNRPQARKYYELALADDPLYRPALWGLAVLDFEAGLYEKAIEQLRKALQRQPNDDGMSWYFLGLSHLRLNHLEESLRCAYRATRCFGAGSLGYDLAGRVFMRKGDLDKAIQAFKNALAENPTDPTAQDHLIIALYADGKERKVRQLTRKRRESNPTALIPRAVLALQNKNKLKPFKKEVTQFTGEVEFEMIETSLAFAELGLYKEAGRILSAVCVNGIPRKERSPLPFYYLAYYAQQQGKLDKARDYLKQVAQMYKDFVFASRPEAAPVFQYALQENPNDSNAHLHIGNLYGNLGRLTEAVSHWEKAGELNPKLSIAFRNLGLYYWSAGNDLDKAEAYYQKAIQARSGDQTLYRDLSEILIANHKRPEAIRLLETMPFENIRRADIILILAQAYLDEKQYTKTIELLMSTPYFVNWEGSRVTWVIFNKAHMARGKQRFEAKDYKNALKDFQVALTYPENLGVGRMNKLEEAEEYYWQGRALEALGRDADARKAWQIGAEGIEGSEKQNRHRKLCREALPSRS